MEANPSWSILAIAAGALILLCFALLRLRRRRQQRGQEESSIRQRISLAAPDRGADAPSDTPSSKPIREPGRGAASFIGRERSPPRS
jgi:hypothetical protein